MFLVDTNVISELRKGKKANSGVLDFWEKVNPDSIFLAVITNGELRCGIQQLTNRGDAQQANQLEQWLSIVITQYTERIISFDGDCAQVWGKLMANHKQHPIDKQIAAIALMHGVKLITRNTKDFENTGVQVINPFW